MKNIDFTDSVNAAIQGDIDGFEFLYNQSYPYLRMIISKYLKKEEDIEDVLQNTYLKIYSELPNLKEPKTFWKWAGTIATNAALTEIRRQKALKNSKIDYLPPTRDSYEKEDKTFSIEALDEIKVETYYAEFNPEANIEIRETKRLVDEMLFELPQMQRLCILLWQQQFSTREIAEALEIPMGTVKTNIFQAKKKIKANVLELERKGTKLYGMAPLPFFLWVFKLFDTSYADTLPAQGDTALFEQITHAILTQQKTTGQIPSSVKELSSSLKKSSTMGRKIMPHSITAKTILTIVSVGVIGIGGFLGYQAIKTTPKTDDQKITQSENGKESKKETKNVQEVYADTIQTIHDAILNNWESERWENEGFSSEDATNLWEIYHRPTREYHGTATVGETITMQDTAPSASELAKQYTYAYIDLDKNGIPELLFTDTRRENDNDGIFLAALYTIEKNEPKLLLTSRVGNAYYLHDEAIISHELIGNGPIASWHYYQFSEGTFLTKAHLLEDERNNPDTDPSYYYTKNELSTEQLETSAYYKPITKENATEIINSYSGFSESDITFDYVVKIITEDQARSTSDDTFDTQYILPDSDTAYLDDSSVRQLSSEELYIARNEIFARHGRQFKDPKLQSYFGSKSWYSGTIPPERFDETMMDTLNQYETYNIELIKKYETN